MSLAGRIRRLHLAYFSQPAAERRIYRVARNVRPLRIVELGIAAAERAERLLTMAAAYHERPIRYTGIDLFELREETDGQPIELKAVYRRLVRTGAKVRLIPGPPPETLCRMANELGGTDLLLISHPYSDELGTGWRYLPRVLGNSARVLLESRTLDKNQRPRTVWQHLGTDEVHSRAAAIAPPAKKAA